MLANMASANISRIYGATGYNSTSITACAASTQAIGEASELIKNNKADIVITGGAESGICEIGMGGFSTMHALTTWEGDPSKASRPFDANRDGFAPAEGAGIMILESEEHALNRGASPIAEIAGFGVTSDAFHLVQPHKDGLGATNAMKTAIRDAGITNNDIDYINAHGTSPHFSSGTPITAHSSISGIAKIGDSTSVAKTLNPPLIIMSFFRSTMYRKLS